MQPPMRIEAVTVCVGFGDILEHAILANQGIFDRWIIVTSPDDNTTHRVCKRHGIDFVDTDSFGRRGDKFNKGLGINTGLAHIRFDEWVVVLDADILLPARTRWFLENAELDTKCIYGIDRFDLTNWENYQKWKHEINPQYEWFCYIKPPQYTPFATRIVHYDYGGWMPIGFFQLWHKDAGVMRYPVKIDSNAEHVDVLHSMKWPRKRRVLIPEILGMHLESEKLRGKNNWQGRESKPFGAPDSPAPAPDVPRVVIPDEKKVIVPSTANAPKAAVVEHEEHRHPEKPSWWPRHWPWPPRGPFHELRQPDHYHHWPHHQPWWWPWWWPWPPWEPQPYWGAK